MAVIDPWGGYNQGLQNLGQTFTDIQGLQRQKEMDAVNLRQLALKERGQQAGLDQMAAEQGAMQQVYGGPDLQTAYANKMKAELHGKKVSDFFNQMKELKAAGASPDFRTEFAKRQLAKVPEYADMAQSISYIDDEKIKIVKEVGPNQIPDPTNPGQFVPPGTYEVEGVATGDPKNPYKFTTIKPYVDKEAMMDKRFEQQSELQDKRQQAAEERLNKQIAAADARQARSLAATSSRAGTDDVETLASQVVNLQLDPYNISKRGGLQAKVFAAVERMSPGFNLNEAAANYKVMANPNIRKSVMILDSIEPMLDNMQVAHKALNLGKFPLLNKAKITAMRQTGDPDIVAFDNLRNNIVLEVTNAMQGSAQMSDARVKMEADNLQNAQSPAQMRAAIENIREVIMARKSAFKKPAFENPGRGKSKAAVQSGRFTVEEVK